MVIVPAAIWSAATAVSVPPPNPAPEMLSPRAVKDDVRDVPTRFTAARLPRNTDPVTLRMPPAAAPVTWIAYGTADVQLSKRLALMLIVKLESPRTHPPCRGLRTVSATSV